MTASASRDSEVLIVGAGPTGLVLALWLTRLGVRVRIVDKTDQPGTTSRALAVQPRTLEFYRQFGFADAVVARGRAIGAVNLWVSAKKSAHVPIGEMGKGLSPYPMPLIYPQDEHERMLIDRLRELGVEVERQTELIDFDDEADGIRARLRGHDGAEEAYRAAYIAGCDGGHSTVRQKLRIGFPGGAYDHLYYVADVNAHGQVLNGEIHVGLDREDFLALFPLKDEGCARLVGTVRDDLHGREDLSWDDVRTTVAKWMRIEVERVNWFSTYRVHHRVANHFGVGRAFILGDAAHVHSPVGGQGMNTGIGDAVNLAWKLASVLRGRADADLLATYEPERMAFAQRLVETTDRAFTGVVSSSEIALLFRLRLVPRLLPGLLRIPAARRFFFRTVSQTGVNYRRSALSVGHLGDVQGGDRLPWVPTDSSDPKDDNFAPLRSLAWQVHVYGKAASEIEQICAERKLELHVFPWRSAIKRAGLNRNAIYLLRPDGYIAMVDAEAKAASISKYLVEKKIAPLR